ncbi:MAG: endonuclease [Oceanospirillum sp.]|nr:endonuclease [Oceanospirillum sp.]
MRIILLVLTLMLSSGWLWLEQHARDSLVYQGMPDRLNTGWQYWYRILRNEGFVLGYSDYRLNPVWVSYELRALNREQKQQRYSRPGHFEKDWRSIWPVTHDDYTRTGYDRGHMAPNYAISRLYGRKAQLDSFLMTNITPQKPNLNRKLWQRLEEAAIDHFSHQFHRVQVITGPIFSDNPHRLKSLIQVPESFYKVFVGIDKQDQAVSMLAFVMPQDVKGSEPLTKFVVSVDEVEQRTGYDFFSKLNDVQETKLEATIDDRSWNLKQVARKPSRY